jgi:hypothetical protein
MHDASVVADVGSDVDTNVGTNFDADVVANDVADAGSNVDTVFDAEINVDAGFVLACQERQ